MKILLSILISLLIISCGMESKKEVKNDPAELAEYNHDGNKKDEDKDHEHQFIKINENTYGFEEPNKESAIGVADFVAAFGESEEMEGTVSGKITEVCQSAGCWIKVYQDDENSMMVKFKDHFQIPKDLAGKTATFIGKAEKKVYSVDELKHFAEDAGKSQEEINMIKEEKTDIIFHATGVTID